MCTLASPSGEGRRSRARPGHVAEKVRRRRNGPTVSRSGVPPQRHVQRLAAGTVTGCSTRRRLRPPPPSSAPPIRTSQRSSRRTDCPSSGHVSRFPTLVLLILEQQVSLASARAAYDRLAARIGELTPEGVLRSTDEELRADGFSRRRTATSVRSPRRSSSSRSTSTRSACSTTRASARRSSRRGSAPRPRSTSSPPSGGPTRGRSVTSPSRRRRGAPAGSPSARHRASSSGIGSRGDRTARAQLGSSGTSTSASRGDRRSPSAGPARSRCRAGHAGKGVGHVRMTGPPGAARVV